MQYKLQNSKIRGSVLRPCENLDYSWISSSMRKMPHLHFLVDVSRRQLSHDNAWGILSGVCAKLSAKGRNRTECVFLHKLSGVLAPLLLINWYQVWTSMWPVLLSSQERKDKSCFIDSTFWLFQKWWLILPSRAEYYYWLTFVILTKIRSLVTSDLINCGLTDFTLTLSTLLTFFCFYWLTFYFNLGIFTDFYFNEHKIWFTERMHWFYVRWLVFRALHFGTHHLFQLSVYVWDPMWQPGDWSC